MTKTDPTKNRYYDRFGLLLAVSAVTVALLLLVDLDQGEGWAELLAVAVTLLTSTLLIVAVRAAGLGGRALRLAWITVGITSLASVARLLMPNAEAGHGGFIWLVLVIAAPIVALRRLMHHREVTSETVLGAVSVFLLMAIASTYLFLFIDASGLSADGFFGEPQPTTVFMYFSLVTITTLGYGDFSPVGVVGRAAASWVAVIGEIYLVVVVAYIVALYTMAPRRRHDPTLSDDD
jgi:hypothetical protein